jgi:MT-A70
MMAHCDSVSMKVVSAMGRLTAKQVLSKLPPSVRQTPYLSSANVTVRCRLVDEIVWVKCTQHGKLARSHGYYLQHAKEVCLVGRRGGATGCMKSCSDVIVAPRRGQSQKPQEIYDLIEALVPKGAYSALLLYVAPSVHKGVTVARWYLVTLLQYARET